MHDYRQNTDVYTGIIIVMQKWHMYIEEASFVSGNFYTTNHLGQWQCLICIVLELTLNDINNR